jgi:hypothetical protein
MAWRWALEASAGRDLEVPQALLNRTFATQVAVFIGTERNAELVAEPVEVVCIESAHVSIHAALPKNVKLSLREIHQD